MENNQTLLPYLDIKIQCNNQNITKNIVSKMNTNGSSNIIGIL